MRLCIAAVAVLLISGSGVGCRQTATAPSAPPPAPNALVPTIPVPDTAATPANTEGPEGAANADISPEAATDAALPGAEQATSPQPGESGAAPWQSDLQAFRDAVAGALEDVPGPTNPETARNDQRGTDALKGFTGRTVCWTMSFSGYGQSGSLNFAESFPAGQRRTYKGSTQDFTRLAITSAPNAAGAWTLMRQNGIVHMQGEITTITADSRWNKDHTFAGWLPQVTIENARPVAPE